MFISEDLDPEALKNEANIKWKEGNMEEANLIWRQALKECIKYSMRGIPTNKNRDMQISLRLNLSLYHYKKKEYSDCINQCNIIIDNLINLNEMLEHYNMGDEETNKKENNILSDNKSDNISDNISDNEKDKSNDNLREKKYIIKKDILIKIFLRRASSFLCLQEFNKCNEDLDIIKKLENDDVEAAILEKKMIIEKKDYERKQKELYKKMCNSK
ncbi:conserved Plasmodium protein, unknown function [Plasmodium sp. gorilla clade G2]|uniref:conserved Plasmodium protein, unknown function n=1 Tax=Plasmodium sp. gorilla clade G2 TaxID=880535 RepID=UPI000D20C663|nr:conserved Plasmodium protein, unknown function [Plasmodium sp. gorilla clade G2]SOV13147.1 conserved Plasmodium protein, unknown function [Plasmodium sp. gorilla clade G2]